MKPTVTTTALARSHVFNPYLLGGLGYSNPYVYGGLYGTDTASHLRNSLALRSSGYLGYGGLYGAGYGAGYGGYWNNRLLSPYSVNPYLRAPVV
jgi:hypothetical protein